MTEAQWRNVAKGVLKAELKRQNLTYNDLADKLRSIGVDESEVTIRNKISRGAFTFVFALQAMEALGLQFAARRKGDSGHGIDMPTLESVELRPGALAAILKAVRGQ
jgi:hypothetical protein